MEDNGEQLTGQEFPLPAEIIVEILSRLPVKSLRRFRCVSKPWRSLISSTKFIALHDRKAVEDKEVFLGRRRTVFHNPEVRGLYSLNLDEFLSHADNHDDLVTVTELDFVYNEDGKSTTPSWVPFIYYCNNLVLCLTWSGFYLVNPATREMKKVPDTPIWRSPMKPDGMLLNGLGFDYSTNEYKVVNGQFYSDIEAIVFSVYTLKTNAWRQIECPAHYFDDYHRGFYLHGAIHWLVIDTVAYVPVILSFLLAEEEFREIQLPSPITDTGKSLTLGVFRDSLCITFIGKDDKTFDEFWVVKEYAYGGVHQSWTKLRISMPYQMLSLTGFSTKSHDLMIYEKSLVMYNFKEESGRYLRIKKKKVLVGIFKFVIRLKLVIVLEHMLRDFFHFTLQKDEIEFVKR